MQIATKLKNVLESKGYNIILTRNAEDRDTIDMKKSLERRVNIANTSDAELFISIHQQHPLLKGEKFTIA
ncbi:MAG: N-acetylmuramoyl-L-alanine amidase [Clostridium sp.]|nr:N-acetylmuramoyl-L-alanine amidase [Clostridium sp.]